jgi:hypothetical protein
MNTHFMICPIMLLRKLNTVFQLKNMNISRRPARSLPTNKISKSGLAAQSMGIQPSLLYNKITSAMSKSYNSFGQTVTEHRPRRQLWALTLNLFQSAKELPTHQALPRLPRLPDSLHKIPRAINLVLSAAICTLKATTRNKHIPASSQTPRRPSADP